MKHIVVAYAQVILSTVYVGGYFLIVAMFMLGYAHPPSEWKETLTALFSVLTAGVLLILNFWFQRQRESKDATTPAP